MSSTGDAVQVNCPFSLYTHTYTCFAHTYAPPSQRNPALPLTASTLIERNATQRNATQRNATQRNALSRPRHCRRCRRRRRRRRRHHHHDRTCKRTYYNVEKPAKPNYIDIRRKMYALAGPGKGFSSFLFCSSSLLLFLSLSLSLSLFTAAAAAAAIYVAGRTGVCRLTNHMPP